MATAAAPSTTLSLNRIHSHRSPYICSETKIEVASLDFDWEQTPKKYIKRDRERDMDCKQTK